MVQFHKIKINKKFFTIFFLLNFSILLLAFNCHNGNGGGEGDSCDECPNTTLILCVDYYYELEGCNWDPDYPGVHCFLNGDWDISYKTQCGKSSSWLNSNVYKPPFQKNYKDCCWIWGGNMFIEQEGFCVSPYGSGYHYYYCYQKVIIPAIPCNKTLNLRVSIGCEC